MCSTTTDAEEKNNSENPIIHSTHRVAPSSPANVDLRTEQNKGDGDNGSSTINQILVSLSLTQSNVKQHTQKQQNFIISDDDDNQIDYRNSSLLEDNFDDKASDVGSISDTKVTHDSDPHVDIKSSNFCSEMLHVGVCEGTTDFAEQMDIFMRCRHPMDLLSMFHENEVDTTNHSFIGGEGDGDSQVHRVSGYHAIPRTCEYCGSPDVNLCRDDPKCPRPRTYFPKERPPFCSKGGPKSNQKTNVKKASSGGEDAVNSAWI